MKKIIISALLSLTTFTYANVNTVVSILPQKTFVKAIGGDKVDVNLMVLPGNSPHTYEPKPSQMRNISKADIYFTIDVEFEHNWLPKFLNQNQNMKVIDLTDGIVKMEMKEHHHHDDEHGHHDKHKEKKHDDHDDHDNHNNHADHADHEEHEEESLDPHVWTSPSNVKVMAKNILIALISKDAKNTNYYINNYNNFIKQINSTDKKIKNILSNVEHGSKFMVFHPAWGYFARDYELTQFAIEAGGKNPKPKQIAYLIEEAKEEKVKAIFTAPEFSERIATQIAKEVGIKVIKVSPLNPKWSENLIQLAEAISHK